MKFVPIVVLADSMVCKFINFCSFKHSFILLTFQQVKIVSKRVNATTMHIAITLAVNVSVLQALLVKPASIPAIVICMV